MSEKTATREVMVINEQGLHARPAHALMILASTFQSDVEIIKDGEPVDGKSILSLLTLAAVRGTRLVVRATGDDAEGAVTAVADLVARGFDELGDALPDGGEASDGTGTRSLDACPSPVVLPAPGDAPGDGP